MKNNEKIEALKIALQQDINTLENCLILLYQMQTENEKIEHTTNVNNGIGFSGCDAKKLTYYANWIKSGKHLTGRFLEDAQRRLIKYAGQLIRIQGEQNAI